MNVLIVFVVGVLAVLGAQAQTAQPSIKPVSVEKIAKTLKDYLVTEVEGQSANGKPCRIEIENDPLANSYYILIRSGQGYSPELSIRLFYGSRWLVSRNDFSAGKTFTFIENSRVRNPNTIVLKTREDLSDFDLTVKGGYGKPVTCSYRE
jgi:hypothetical protein